MMDSENHGQEVLLGAHLADHSNYMHANLRRLKFHPC